MLFSDLRQGPPDEETRAARVMLGRLGWVVGAAMLLAPLLGLIR